MSSSFEQELRETVVALVQSGKGILAADESSPTIAKRFGAIGVESTPDSRRDYRALLLTTPGLGEFISGVILFEETLDQCTAGQQSLPNVASQQAVVPGIKVDRGKIALANATGEEITEGLDGLAQRLVGYKSKGARFAKWRAVLHIGDSTPSAAAIAANAEVLARYAAICQAQGIVPIVEPEVLIDGDHGMARSAQVSEVVLRALFAALARHQVVLEHTLLKPSMVVPGKLHSRQAQPDEVARRTIEVFRRVVPAALPGIFFLSGGLTPEQATANLDALNRLPQQPWELSFSFGRALQQPVLAAWGGEANNTTQAQNALYQRARLNGAARLGRYSPAMEGRGP